MSSNLGQGIAALAITAGVVVRYATAIAGAGGIAYGAWLFSEPLGYVTGGGLLLAGSILDAMGSGRAT